MREACLYNKWCFSSSIFENLQGINEMNPLEFFFVGGWWVVGRGWWGVAMMSPRDGGTHQEWGVEGRGMRAPSQILSDVSLSYSLKHISTRENSLHISWESLISYIYISCFHDDVILYSRYGRKRRRSYTYHTWQQSYSLLAYLGSGERLCVCQKLPARNNATIVINACNHRQYWKSKWCNHRQGHIFLLSLLHRMGIK